MKNLFVAGLMLMIKIAALGAGTTEPTGASAAFTSSDPVVDRAIKLIAKGSFREARSLLEKTDGDVSARAEALEIMRRISTEYSTDAPTLVAKLKASIPDVSEADLKRWTDARQVQFRRIDGKVFYFNREPANLFRFCEEAKRRRETAGKKPADERRWKLTDHLKDVIAEAERTGQPEVRPVKHRITYSVTIPAQTENMKSGSVVRVWLPFPQEYRQQKDVKLMGTTPAHKNVSKGVTQRSIYFEQKVVDPSQEMKFTEVFEYTSSAYYPKLEDSKAQALPADWGGLELGERPPHIVFTPELRRQVKQIVGSETNPLVKVRQIFHWVDRNIAYHAEEEYGTIDSFARKAWRCRRGDCGIQSTLFITMCRIAGVPARWQSGWETKPIGWTMHDWAEVYVAPWGWIPVDVSYGVQKSDDLKIADFFIGHLDSYRMIVNLDYGNELSPAKKSMRSEPADFQRGEVEVDGKNLYFDQWDYEMKIERDPGPNF